MRDGSFVNDGGDEIDLAATPRVVAALARTGLRQNDALPQKSRQMWAASRSLSDVRLTRKPRHPPLSQLSGRPVHVRNEAEEA